MRFRMGPQPLFEKLEELVVLAQWKTIAVKLSDLREDGQVRLQRVDQSQRELAAAHVRQYLVG